MEKPSVVLIFPVVRVRRTEKLPFVVVAILMRPSVVRVQPVQGGTVNAGKLLGFVNKI